MLINGLEAIHMVRSKFSINDNNGSVLITIAIFFIIFILATALVIDIGRAFVYKVELNKACMIAAEESIKCIDIDKARNFGENVLADDFEEEILYFFYSNIHNRNSYNIENIGYEVVENKNNPKYVKVYCKANIDCNFLNIIGINKISINSFSNGRVRRIK